MIKRIIAVTVAAGFLGVSGFSQANPLKASGAGEVTKTAQLPQPKKVKPRPCYRHTSETKPTKGQCLKIYKAKRKRDSIKFPPNPTKADVAKRVPDWRGFVRLGRCEQPGYSKYGDGVNWSHSGPTWGGGLGVYRSTWYAARSPYKLWSGDKWETILVGDAIRDRFGITAWGAHRCFYG